MSCALIESSLFVFSILSCSVGESDFSSRMNKVKQLTGLSDPVYAETYVAVHEYDIVLDILVINQTDKTLQVGTVLSVPLVACFSHWWCSVLQGNPCTCAAFRQPHILCTSA